MKTKHIFIYLMLALPALLLQSCLKDDKDYFDETSSQRMDNYLQQLQDTLTKAPYGWAMDYYAKSDQSYGGYTYSIKFGKEDATVGFELQPGNTLTSHYSLKKDYGPVLSFDTYNVFLHFFSTPQSGLYQGYEGDFEFVVDSIGSDKIKMHGKKSHNTIYLRRLNEPAESFLDKVETNGDNFNLIAAQAKIGGKDAAVYFDTDNRQVEIDTEKDTITSAYTFTDKGLRLYKPTTVNGVTVYDLAYDDDNLTLTANGFSTVKGYQNPNTVTNAVNNAVGSDDKVFSRTYRNIPHLDQFRVVTKADWLTVKTEGNNLTLEATANNTGSLRSAVVYVINGSFVKTFTVTQCDVKDIAGTYTFYYYDANGTQQKSTATIASTSTGVTVTFVDAAYGNKLSTPATFNQSTGTVDIAGGYNGYKVQSQSGGTYYCYNSFLIGNGTRIAFSSAAKASLVFGYNSKYGTYAELGGDISGYTPEAYIVWVGKSADLTSYDETLGYLAWFEGMTLIKQSSSAKAMDTAAGTLAKKAVVAPANTKKYIPFYKK